MCTCSSAFGGFDSSADAERWHADAQQLLSTWCCTSEAAFKGEAGKVPYILPPLLLNGQPAWAGSPWLKWEVRCPVLISGPLHSRLRLSPALQLCPPTNIGTGIGTRHFRRRPSLTRSRSRGMRPLRRCSTPPSATGARIRLRGSAVHTCTTDPNEYPMRTLA